MSQYLGICPDNGANFDYSLSGCTLVQVCVVENERLFQELKEVLTSPNEDVCLPPLTLLHSLCRLLYSDCPQYVSLFVNGI